MSEEQDKKAQLRQFYRSVTILGAIGTIFGVINLFVRDQLISDGESQPAFVMILSYGALLLGLIALIGGLIMLNPKK
ncbi:hypothetical protein [Rhodoblastus sp.]|uniref:hypothetical protein n=1 Tax=Rhodoblastus sp. TaxID=1962975 RepID=UPI003F96665B